MREKADLISDLQVGERAKQVLNDPMVQDAINGMREAVFHNIRTSHHSKSEEREDLYKMLRAIDEFEKQFTQKINGGKKAKTLLEKLFKGE